VSGPLSFCGTGSGGGGGGGAMLGGCAAAAAVAASDRISVLIIMGSL
jgi:hypothetical protein